MTITVYADVLFLINFCMDYIILHICGRLVNKKCKLWRILVSASFGAIYSVCIFFPQLQFMYTAILKIIISIVIVGIAFPCRGVKNFFMQVLLFYVISFAFGGACMAILYFTDCGNKSMAIVKNGAFYFQLPMKMLVISTVIAYICITIISRFIKNNKCKEIYDVTICFDNKQTIAKGFLDTGNCLIEPITQKPVVVVQWNVVRNILPTDCTYDNFINHISPDRIRMIPYKSVGQKSGVMFGMCVDEIIFSNYHIPKAIIGIYEGELSRQYSVLLHRGLVI